MTVRQFLQTSGDGRNSVRELLQSVFAAELLAPSKTLWIVSAWLRDIPVLDNSTGGFLALAPELPHDEVRLSRVLLELLERGTQLVIATRPGDAGNRQVLDALTSVTTEPLGSRISFVERASLHVKGLIGDRFALTGSMNLTFNGIDNLTEMLVFQTERREVEALRVMFSHEYGGIA
jgi:hypothetical protein